MRITRLFPALILCFLALSAKCMAQDTGDSLYLFSYAAQADNGVGGLRFACSPDGREWTSIGDGYAFVTSDYGAWGSGKKMYSPSLERRDDGMWFAVWSVGEDVCQVATTSSPDLVHWKPQDYPFTGVEGGVVDPRLSIVKGSFRVEFSTKDGMHYQCTSDDFKSWSECIGVRLFAGSGKRAAVTIDGVRYEGQVHKVERSLVDAMKEKARLAGEKSAKYTRGLSDDATLFAGLSPVKATLVADMSKAKAISPDLVGIFFEDISWGADGGLYAELVRNRDFEFSPSDHDGWNPSTGWSLRGRGTKWELSSSEPLDSATPTYSILRTSSPGASLLNEGFDGVRVENGVECYFSIWARSLDGKPHVVDVSIEDGENVIAKASIAIDSPSWKKYESTMVPSADAPKAVLALSPRDEGDIAIDFVSLFPSNTFKGRRNGVRKDLAEYLAALNPKFMRFPGGCVTHGNGLGNIYRWKNTIGPVEKRKGDFNIWHYHQSMGLGFYEYFQLCEDLGCEPLPVIAAGVPCQNSSVGGGGQQGGIPMEDMPQYLQDILDLIEWANGDPAASKWAAMRAEAGHPEPFNLKYVGIGNEDLMSDVFLDRYIYLVEGVRKAHPEIIVIGTVGPFNEGSDYEWGWKVARENDIPIVDEHYYNAPGWFLGNTTFYDSYPKTGPKVYLGEYASWGNTLENALVEAAYLTGIERNGDVVLMSSYAPLFARKGRTSWNPDLIYFDNEGVYPTVNYFVQKLFGNNGGDCYIPSEMTSSSPDSAKSRLFSSIVRDSASGDVIVKICNILPVSASVEIDPSLLGRSGDLVRRTELHGSVQDKDVSPVESVVSVSKGTPVELKPYSFTVLRFSR